MLKVHVSDINSHDQVSDPFQRVGVRFDSTFVDASIHPRFSTRKVALPLQNSHYLEVVRPVNYSSSSSTSFGKAASQCTAEGGGWPNSVVEIDDVSNVKERLGRVVVDGQRTEPDRKDLAWKQIEVHGTLEDKQLTYFIDWLSLDYLLNDGKAMAKFVNVESQGMNHASKSGLAHDFVQRLVYMLKLNGLMQSQAKVNQVSLLCMW
jgi:hypothetical protein